MSRGGSTPPKTRGRQRIPFKNKGQLYPDALLEAIRSRKGIASLWCFSLVTFGLSTERFGRFTRRKSIRVIDHRSGRCRRRIVREQRIVGGLHPLVKAAAQVI